MFTREGVERAEAEKLFRGEGGLEDKQFQAGKVEKKLSNSSPVLLRDLTRF